MSLLVCLCLLVQFLEQHDQLTATQAAKVWSAHTVTCSKQVAKMRAELEAWETELGEREWYMGVSEGSGLDDRCIFHSDV